MSDSKNSIYIGALPKDAREDDLRVKVTEWAGPFEHLYYKPGTGERRECVSMHASTVA